ncbi:MarR family winged helix-turn-helix transcriptional regulator [Nocardia sp. NPDC059177]|uniref:MarR family winged helix-turn-helix transcriptional regulator n=1 Tax=Nocardia sp. NPDC059177 TaxID=3346759 RepID=UPI0036AE7F35
MRERRALDLFVKLVHASASVEARTSGPVLAAGLTSSQFGALETLYFVGPLPAGQLADKHLKSPNNFTLVITNLEKRGLVRREKAPNDRRVVLIELTPAGREIVEATMPSYVQAIVTDLDVLTPAEQDQLAALLRKLGRADLR